MIESKRKETESYLRVTLENASNKAMFWGRAANNITVTAVSTHGNTKKAKIKIK